MYVFALIGVSARVVTDCIKRMYVPIAHNCAFDTNSVRSTNLFCVVCIYIPRVMEKQN